MGAAGNFPIDLVLFGMIAAFLVLRLRSILGRRAGFERAAPPAASPGGPVIEGRAEPVAAKPVRPLPVPASPAGQALAAMRAVDRGFDPAHFLEGAEQAFRMVVGAYARGDRAALRPLLTDEAYRAFEAAIAAREAAGETQRSDIRAINVASIEQAVLTGTLASIAVRFVSDQVNMTVDKENRPVAGTDAVTEIVDLWTFERDLRSNDPVWRLAAARSA